MSAFVSADLRRRVRTLFCDCCAYCRTAEHLVAATFEVEHITPRASGGEAILANLCLACPTCNRCKADRVFATDPETQHAVGLYHPHDDKWSAHFTWNEDATEIIPLTPAGRATVAALRMNRPALVRVRRMWVLMGEHPPKTE